MDYQVFDDVRPAEQAGEAEAYQAEAMRLRDTLSAYYERIAPDWDRTDHVSRSLAATVDRALEAHSVDEARRILREKREAVARQLKEEGASHARS